MRYNHTDTCADLYTKIYSTKGNQKIMSPLPLRVGIKLYITKYKAKMAGALGKCSLGPQLAYLSGYPCYLTKN